MAESLSVPLEAEVGRGSQVHAEATQQGLPPCHEFGQLVLHVPVPGPPVRSAPNCPAEGAAHLQKKSLQQSSEPKKRSECSLCWRSASEPRGTWA